MSTVPTDSVLRRHHEQMRQAARPSADPGHVPGPAEPASPPTPDGDPAPAPEPSTGQGGGFFGWLKRLFGS